MTTNLWCFTCLLWDSVTRDVDTHLDDKTVKIERTFLLLYFMKMFFISVYKLLLFGHSTLSR